MLTSLDAPGLAARFAATPRSPRARPGRQAVPGGVRRGDGLPEEFSRLFEGRVGLAVGRSSRVK